MLAERTGEFVDALNQDLGKGATEAKFSEIDVVRAEIDHAQKHLAEWMDSTSVKVPLALQPAIAKVEPRPVRRSTNYWAVELSTAVDARPVSCCHRRW